VRWEKFSVQERVKLCKVSDLCEEEYKEEEEEVIMIIVDLFLKLMEKGLYIKRRGFS
jgi:predicted RecB family nuclease